MLSSEILKKYHEMEKPIIPDIQITTSGLKKQSQEINAAFAQISIEDICTVFNELNDCYDELIDFLDLSVDKLKVLDKYISLYNTCCIFAINRTSKGEKDA